MMPSSVFDRVSDTVLVLGGGNALGAYLAGAYEELHGQEVRPDWIVGASIGAITGAILAGNPPEHRVEKLTRFWNEAMLPTSRMLPFQGVKQRQIYNGLNIALAALFGRPSIFRHRYPGLWSALPWVPNDVALFDTAPLRATLERLQQLLVHRHQFDIQLFCQRNEFAVVCGAVAIADQLKHAD